jgi:hypothetical protein
VFDDIERFYNRKRRPSAPEYGRAHDEKRRRRSAVISLDVPVSVAKRTGVAVAVRNLAIDGNAREPAISARDHTLEGSDTKGKMVGVRGFEPPTSSSRSWRSTRLSYTPSKGGWL